MGTTDGGATFTDLHGNLPSTFQNVNAAEFIDSNGVRTLRRIQRDRGRPEHRLRVA